ncbi:MAG: hypothetical protein CSYNP_02950 [Syntrophus sp. SKADARSKE-3]|nr:hypothetical protein [Syntrophus sp. SKADARSKE-3]
MAELFPEPKLKTKARGFDAHLVKGLRRNSFFDRFECSAGLQSCKYFVILTTLNQNRRPEGLDYNKANIANI